MSTKDNVQRDERTVAVENAGYRWAYTFVAFALLIDVMYRAVAHQEAAWDLMALVIAGGAVCGSYQILQKALPGRAVFRASLIALVAGVLAAVAALVLAFTEVM